MINKHSFVYSTGFIIYIFNSEDLVKLQSIPCHVQYCTVLYSNLVSYYSIRVLLAGILNRTFSTTGIMMYST